MSRRPLVAFTAIVLAAALAGCSPTVAAKPAADANDPLCAEVTVQLPTRLGDLAKRNTDAQATGAWGDPVQVLLTCGVRVPGPSSLTCLTVDGVDWLRDDRKAPLYVYTTFGRRPAVDVAFRTAKVSAQSVLSDLGDAVKETKRNGLRCR